MNNKFPERFSANVTVSDINLTCEVFIVWGAPRKPPIGRWATT